MITFVAVLAVGTAACGDTSSPNPGGPVASEPAGGAVVIDTFMFMPGTIKVAVGDSVTWTNQDDILHTVTSGDREYAPDNGGLVVATNKDGRFDERLNGRGATTTVAFPEAGSFHYFCDVHPGMEADVEVT
ncbi:MAG: plastocyanin/azurin family copper-binding protein [Acidimicrobiales bacterium]